MKTVLSTVLALTLLSSAAAAYADEPRASDVRYTTLVVSTNDGAPSSDPTAERAMKQAMVGSGATFLDLAQVKRSQTDVNVRDLARGVVSGELTAFEADMLVAMDVRAFRDEGSSLLAETNWFRYQATIDASLISTGTGQAVAIFSASHAATDTTAARAMRTALERAGESIAQQILEQKKQPNRVELWVEAVPIADLDRLREALLAVPGVRATKAFHVSPALSKISLSLDATAPVGADLVEAIHRTSGVGITITSFSDHLFRAEHGSRMKILFTNFSGKRPDVGARLAESIGAPLLDRPQLVQATDAPVHLARSSLDREKQLEKLGLLEEDALFLTGSYFERASAELDVEAELRSTRPGFTLFARDRDTCSSAKLTQCTNELAARLLAKLPKAIARNRAASVPVPSNIEVSRVVLEKEILPARAAAYEKRGIGRVIVENRSRFRATGGSIRVQLEGFDPVFGTAGDLAPGATLEVPIPLSLNKLPEQAYTAQLRLEVGYDVTGRRERVDRAERMRVFGPRSMSWIEPESIAAFVSDTTEDVKRLAGAALAAIPADRREEPTAVAAALFHARSGLRYQGDSFVPGGRGEIDDVQLPVETLIRGAGDCDDFAVLYAALSDAAGLRSILLLTPSHVLPAVESDHPAQSAKKISLDPDAVVLYQGRAFIPVETARAGASFGEAWDAARAEIAEVKRNGLALEIVDIRKAWETYPALGFARKREAIAHKPSFSGLAADLDRVRKERALSLEKALGENVDLSRLDARALSERAAILVVAGRTEEAKNVLEHAAKRFPRVSALTNNLANAHLASGAPDTALALYREALKSTKAPESAVRVRLNAAIAAHVKGGVDLFREYLFEASEGATTEAARKIVSEFMDGLEEGEQLTGAAARTLDRRTFAARVRRVIEGNRYLRAKDRSMRAGIAENVYWLDPEGP